MDLSQQEVRQLKEKVNDLSHKLNEVHAALVGSHMTKDGGLVQRVIDSELELEKLKLRISSIENANTRTSTYVKIIWAMGGTIGAMVFAYILKLAFQG